MKASVYLIIGYMLLSACSTQQLLQPQRSLPDSLFSKNTSYSYTIRKDDKISISVWDHDDLSIGSVYGIYNSNEVYGKWLLVNAKGEIAVPKLGAIQAEGLSTAQLEDSLRIHYSKWILNPVVFVKVLNKEVTVLGEVRNPGKIQLEKEENRLLEVLGQAGDFDFYADKRKLRIIRMQQGRAQTLQVDLTGMDSLFTQNLLLMPGDVVIVPSRKGKMWDKKAASIVPITSIITSVMVVLGFLSR